MSHIYESLSRILEIWNAWASFDPWFPRPSSGNENPNWLEIFGKVFQVYPFWLLRVVERTWARHGGRTMRGLDRTLPFPLQFELRILVFRLRIRDVFVLIRPNLVRISIFAKIRVNLFYLRFNPYPWILKKKSKSRVTERVLRKKNPERSVASFVYVAVLWIFFPESALGDGHENSGIRPLS